MIEKLYNLGNYFLARKKALEILKQKTKDMNLQKQAHDILHKTGIDKLVILAGITVFMAISLLAFLVRFSS